MIESAIPFPQEPSPFLFGVSTRHGTGLSSFEVALRFLLAADGKPGSVTQSAALHLIFRAVLKCASSISCFCGLCRPHEPRRKRLVVPRGQLLGFPMPVLILAPKFFLFVCFDFVRQTRGRLCRWGSRPLTRQARSAYLVLDYSLNSFPSV